MNRFNTSAGDIWYIYFKENDIHPYFGIISKIKWSNIFEIESLMTDQNLVDIENETTDLIYTIDIERLTIQESQPPTPNVFRSSDVSYVTKSSSPETAGRKEKNRKIKGNMGEKIALEIEKRRFIDMNRADLIPKITYVAQKKDGLGYDIISIDFDEDGNEKEIYIEVKSTSGDINTPFYVTHNEVMKSEELGSSFFIYRKYNLFENSYLINYYKVLGPISSNFKLEPIDYRATLTEE